MALGNPRLGPGFQHKTLKRVKFGEVAAEPWGVFQLAKKMKQMHRL